ncbi:MAG: beta-ketoacyl-[acyl-carrier-protein] synthase family protein [Burkholderiaceae bacterium]
MTVSHGDRPLPATRRRIAVTGLGLVSPHGRSPRSMFDALRAGRSAIDWDDELGTVLARSSVDECSTPASPVRKRSGIDRVSEFAIAAGEDAVADADWSESAPPYAPDRVGIYVGTGFGGTATIAEAYRRFHEGERLPPLSVVSAMANAPAAHLAIRTGFTGPVLTFSVACASSSVAIAAGAKDIALGEIDAALVGGAEAPLVDSMIASWKAMHTLAEGREGDMAASCRPFSATRTGLALGEGSAFLILEEMEHAQLRGARIYAELAGSGTSCDSAHLTKPQVDGQLRAMRKAITQAGLVPEAVTYCNAHGTATVVGDEIEARSIGILWGSGTKPFVSSTKAMHGHLLGAAGAIEAVVTTLSVHTGQLPPSVHCDDPDPASPLRLVPIDHDGGGASVRRAAITNSFAFGGTNSSLVFRSVD